MRSTTSGTEVRCLVLTGAGRAFCTGANLQGRNNQKPGKSNAGASLEIGFHPFLRRLRKLHCPIVTAVNGPAAGAGMSFALMGDMILCARSSYFLQAFRRIGLVPDCGSTWLLPRHDRQGALGRTVADGRAAAGGEGAGMGPRQPRL